MPEHLVDILCVCTGNVCRSPAAERLLLRHLPSTVSVSSAGTHALSGEPVWPPIADLLRSAGADPSGFEARQVTPSMISAADLILVMSTEHRAATLELAPAAVRKTFTLREFGRLITAVQMKELNADSTEERILATIPAVAAQRRPVPDNSVNDVIDPYRRSAAVCQQAFSEIYTAVTTMIGAFSAPSRQEDSNHQQQ